MSRLKQIANSEIGKRFLYAILFGIGGTIISKAVLMLFNIITARILGETQYGIYSIINNTVQTFTVFASAGIGVTLTRYVALYRDKDKAMAGIVIKTLLIFTAFLTAVISIIVFCFAGDISNLISEQVNITSYIRITSGTIFFTSITLILQSILQGFEEYKKIAVAQIISNIIMLMIGLIITRIFGIAGTIVALLILQLVSTIFFALIIRKIIRIKEIKLKFEFNTTVKEAIKKVAIPAFISSIFIVPLLWITNFVFTSQNGYEQFAAFSVCLQWFTILNFLPQQLGQVKPIYTQLYDEKKIKELKKITNKMIIFSTSFSMVAAIILMFGNSIILNIYGEFYQSYSLPFIIMLVASIFFAIQSQYGSIFQAIGKTWMSLGLTVVWSISFIISFVLLYKQGVMGYALTYLISYAIYSMMSTFLFNMIMKNVLNKEKKV